MARLRPLQDLTIFSVEGNPLAGLPHSRQFMIFQLRSLQILDRMDVTQTERDAADERFAQGKFINIACISCLFVCVLCGVCVCVCVFLS